MDREYGIWVFNPTTGIEPRVIPAASSRYWAERRSARYRQDGVIVKVVYRYAFMPDMPWEDA